jgi:hypothetical protein
LEFEKKKKLTFFTMPYCTFCGKLCTTVSGLDRHIAQTPDCKKASCEKFGQYANSIWDDIPANPNHPKQRPLENLPDLPDFLDLPDFHLEEEMAIAEEMINAEEINLPQEPPPPQNEPPPHPPPDIAAEAVLDGGRYIENFPDEYLAGATWGRCKPLFECLNEEQKRTGGNRWAPFEDEEEWQLAEWLIRNVGQKQTDDFLKLPIVSFLSHCFVNICDYQMSDSRTYETHLCK